MNETTSGNQLCEPGCSGLPSLRRILPVAILSLIALGGPVAAADWDFGFRGGLWGDEPDGFAGIELVGELGSDWYINPTAEAIFVDRGDLFALSVDFHRDFRLSGSKHFWLGAGPTLLLRDRVDRQGPDADVDDTDFGGNLLAGIGFLDGPVRPYLQAKLVISDDTEAVLGFGLRIH